MAVAATAAVTAVASGTELNCPFRAIGRWIALAIHGRGTGEIPPPNARTYAAVHGKRQEDRDVYVPALWRGGGRDGRRGCQRDVGSAVAVVRMELKAPNEKTPRPNRGAEPSSSGANRECGAPSG